MSKRDYEAIALVLRSHRPTKPVEGFGYSLLRVQMWTAFVLIVRDLAKQFAQDNPQFDTAKFRLACGDD